MMNKMNKSYKEYRIPSKKYPNEYDLVDRKEFMAYFMAHIKNPVYYSPDYALAVCLEDTEINHAIVRLNDSGRRADERTWKRSKQTLAEFQEENMTEKASSPEDDMSREQGTEDFLKRLVRFKQGLTEEERIIFEAKSQQVSTAEISRILNIKEHKARDEVSRLRKKLIDNHLGLEDFRRCS